MNPISLSSLAAAFNATATLIGIPSLAVLLLYAINEIRMRLSSAPSATTFGDNPDALLTVLKVMTETVGALGRFAGAIGQFLFNGLAIIAGVGLLLAIALWLTSKGLQANASWARLSAFALLLLGLLPSLLLALSMQNLPRLVMLLIVALCGLGMYALFAPQVPQPH